jgi:formylglycine-generating enzyme required for sulfatase activity
MDAILFDPETSTRRALILALGTYGSAGLSPGEREPLITRLLDLYRNDPDAGIHGAAEWTLRKWGEAEKLNVIDANLPNLNNRANRRWFVNGQGQTFALIEGPVEFRMGSPPTETERIAGNEPLRQVVIPRRFAVATKEVSVAQFQRFLKQAGITNDRYHLSPSLLQKFSPDPDGPWIGPDWYTAAHYCNWLSEQEGLPTDQWCYIPAPGGAYAEGMTVPADVLERTGYRLPTEAEWEYACRAGTTTARYYGASIDLLGAYAHYQGNRAEHAWPSANLLPSDLGLFDTPGNVFEWTHDMKGGRRPVWRGTSYDYINISSSIMEKYPRVMRGGSFDDQPALVRSAYRSWIAPAYRNSYIGFRPSRTYY